MERASLYAKTVVSADGQNGKDGEESGLDCRGITLKTRSPFARLTACRLWTRRIWAKVCVEY